MFKVGRERGVVDRFEELNNLDLSIRTELQAAVVEQVLRESATTTVLIDGHLVVDSIEGFVAGFPGSQLGRINLDAIVVLTAPPSDVIARRIRKGSAGTNSLTSDAEARAILHESLTIQAALFYALQNESILEVVKNVENELDKTVRQVIDKVARIVPTGM